MVFRKGDLLVAKGYFYVLLGYINGQSRGVDSTLLLSFPRGEASKGGFSRISFCRPLLGGDVKGDFLGFPSVDRLFLGVSKDYISCGFGGSGSWNAGSSLTINIKRGNSLIFPRVRGISDPLLLLIAHHG